MSNSNLVSCVRLSPNYYSKRTHSIDRISPHCAVAQCSAERLGEIFANPAKNASANYGIGKDGRIGMYVEEDTASKCTSNQENDQRAVTIECASDTVNPYAMTDEVYESLIKLCADICKRNGKKKLVWISKKETALEYEPKKDEMLITVHRWFKKKSCPGQWLMDRMADLAARVTLLLEEPAPAPTEYPQVPFLVKVLVDDLNYRTLPSMQGVVMGQTGKGIFTITDVSNGWGKLQSKVGWIYIANPDYCTILNSVAKPPFEPYKIKVETSTVEIRKNPSIYASINRMCPVGKYTICEEQEGAGASMWGKLKSGAGWINLDKVKVTK